MGLGCSLSHLVRESAATGIGIESVVLVGPSTQFRCRKVFMIVATTSPNRLARVPAVLVQVGQLVSRYGLVIVLAWIGFGKYVKMEARVLIEHSPLMSWVYDYLNVATVARALGTMEIVAALLISVRPLWPRVSAVGSMLAVVLFVGTISFLFTTPGVVATHAEGLPVLSAQPGQFLLKDLVLIGVAIWTLGDCLGANRRPSHDRAATRQG